MKLASVSIAFTAIGLLSATFASAVPAVGPTVDPAFVLNCPGPDGPCRPQEFPGLTVRAAAREPSGSLLFGLGNGGSTEVDGSGRILAGGDFGVRRISGTAFDGFNPPINSLETEPIDHNTVKTPFGVRSIAAQSNGQVLVGGIFDTVSGQNLSRNNIARFDADGSVDTSFTIQAGGLWLDAGQNQTINSGTEVNVLTVEPSGNVLVGGILTGDFGSGLRTFVGRLILASSCTGDCGADGEVTVNELITMVNIALGTSDVAACAAGDANNDGAITINEIIAAVNNALNGCPPEPTSTPVTPRSTPTATPTLTQTPLASPTSTRTATATALPTRCAGGFCDNGDGTITDTHTGLMWEKKSDDGTIHDQDDEYSWSSSESSAQDGTAYTTFLATLNDTAHGGANCFAGHCDWRLPKSGGFPAGSSGDPAELESIRAAPFPCTGLKDPCVPPVFNTGCMPGCTVTGCSCTQSSSYWSATNDAAIPGFAFVVNFLNGSVSGTNKTFSNGFVRAVRGGETPPPTPTPCTSGFCDNGDGTITDSQTGLMWEKKSDAGDIHDQDNRYTWSSSGTQPDGTVFTDFLATLNDTAHGCFAGHCDWRLPTTANVAPNLTGQAPELESIEPSSCPAAPCVQPEFNTNCTPGCTATDCSCTQSDYYWSATTFFRDRNYALNAFFGYGYNPTTLKTGSIYARAVRFVSRYVDHGDGTITDNSTGLMWEKKSNDGGIHDQDNVYTWSSTGTMADGTAFTTFLATLNTPPCFAGHCDWRLPLEEAQGGPGSKELGSILAAPSPCTGFAHPCVPPAFNTGCTSGCTVTGCSCTQSDSYWSATTVAGNQGSVWFVHFGDGVVGVDIKTFGFYVRAVRAGSRYADHGDGTISDNYTGLMWEKKSDDGGIHDWNNFYTWSSSGEQPDGTAYTIFLATLNTAPCFAGHCDWRLPSQAGQNAPFTGATELQSLRVAPAPCAGFALPCVPPAFNTGCTPGCTVTGCSCTQSLAYWSSTTQSSNTFGAWEVGFGDDDTGGNSKDAIYYVRAVRGDL